MMHPMNPMQMMNLAQHNQTQTQMLKEDFYIKEIQGVCKYVIMKEKHNAMQLSVLKERNSVLPHLLQLHPLPIVKGQLLLLEELLLNDKARVQAQVVHLKVMHHVVSLLQDVRNAIHNAMQILPADARN